jgi:hypothetical protein
VTYKRGGNAAWFGAGFAAGVVAAILLVAVDGRHSSDKDQYATYFVSWFLLAYFSVYSALLFLKAVTDTKKLSAIYRPLMNIAMICGGYSLTLVFTAAYLLL